MIFVTVYTGTNPEIKAANLQNMRLGVIEKLCFLHTACSCQKQCKIYSIAMCLSCREYILDFQHFIYVCLLAGSVF